MDRYERCSGYSTRMVPSQVARSPVSLWGPRLWHRKPVCLCIKACLQLSHIYNLILDLIFQQNMPRGRGWKESPLKLLQRVPNVHSIPYNGNQLLRTYWGFFCKIFSALKSPCLIAQLIIILALMSSGVASTWPLCSFPATCILSQLNACETLVFVMSYMPQELCHFTYSSNDFLLTSDRWENHC